jgi:hypothetical protein
MAGDDEAKIKYFREGDSEGVPLGDFVKQQEEEAKKGDVEDAYTEERVGKGLLRRRRIRHEDKVLERIRGDRRSGRCRDLTNGQIRKEKGLMAKKYRTMIENILWVIINKGPVQPHEIQKETGYNLGNVTSALSRITQRMGKVIVRDTSKMPFVYECAENISTERAYQIWQGAYRTKGMATAVAKRGAKREAESVDIGDLDSAVSFIKKSLAGGASNLKVDVNVTVRVGFLKE